MGTAFGYYVYLVRAARRRKPSQLFRLNEAGDHGADLLTLIRDNLDAMGGGYHSQADRGEGFRIRDCSASKRTLWVRINRGPEGVPGETWDLDEETGTDTSERMALLSGLRAMFALPSDSYFGLLFVEKVGQRNLKELLVSTAVEPAQLQSGALIRLESFAELRDWQHELDSLSAVRVSESLATRTHGDDASTAEDTIVHISASGGGVQRATDRVKEIFFNRVRRRDDRLDVLRSASQLGELRRQAEADGVTFQSEDEFQAQIQRLQDLNEADEFEPDLAAVVDDVVPVDREASVHKKFDVSLGDGTTGHSQRTIAIEGRSIPMFKYELGGRLTDSGLRKTWVAHAESILNARGVNLPPDWA